MLDIYSVPGFCQARKPGGEKLCKYVKKIIFKSKGHQGTFASPYASITHYVSAFFDTVSLRFASHVSIDPDLNRRIALRLPTFVYPTRNAVS